MTPKRHINRWRAFALLAVAYFMTVVDFTIVNVSLPTIGRDLHLSSTGMQWVVTAYALTFGGFLLFGGRAADLLGRRRILMLGLALFTAASLACALATSDALLIASRAVQGLGGAIMLPAALSIVMNMFQEGAERNKALGIWGGLGATAGTTGLIAGGILTKYAGWQSIFYLNVPIGVVALALAPRIIPDSRLATTGRRFDVLGAIAGTGGLVLLVDAISQAPQYGWGATRTIVLLAASVAVLIAFLGIESRVKDPLLPLSIFGLRMLAGANVAGLLLGGSFFAFVFAGTLYMQQVLHYSALQTGAAWAAASVTSMALAAVSQLLVTRIGPTIVMAIGMTMIGTGIIWATERSRPRALPGQPRRPVPRRRGRDGVLIHPHLRRRADGHHGAAIRTRLGAAEHLHADRRRDRDSDRLQRGGQRHQHPASHGRRAAHGVHRWLSPDVLGAGSDRADRTARDLRDRAPDPALTDRGPARDARRPSRALAATN